MADEDMFDEVDMLLTELDFVTAGAMIIQGKTYEEAQQQARQWVKEAREDDREQIT